LLPPVRLPAEKCEIKDCETAEEWMDNCDRDMKRELGLDDTDLAYLHLRRGLNCYLKSLGRDYLTQEVIKADS